MMKMTITSSIAVMLMMAITTVVAFTNTNPATRTTPTSSSTTTASTTTRLQLVDPITVNVGIAVVSAAAGAATQIPKIQELERELDIAKLALTEVCNVKVQNCNAAAVIICSALHGVLLLL